MTNVERIDDILKDRGISRRQLALMAHIPPSSLQSAMERNRTLSFEMQEKIARVLSVSLYELLGDDERKFFIEAEAGTISNYIKQGYKFTTDEKLLVRLFHLLNETGKDAAIDRVGDLTEIPRYRAETAPESTLDSNEGKDTPPPSEAAETAAQPPSPTSGGKDAPDGKNGSEGPPEGGETG